LIVPALWHTRCFDRRVGETMFGKYRKLSPDQVARNVFALSILYVLVVVIVIDVLLHST
jgi:hypothetical protein